MNFTEIVLLRTGCKCTRTFEAREGSFQVVCPVVSTDGLGTVKERWFQFSGRRELDGTRIFDEVIE